MRHKDQVSLRTTAWALDKNTKLLVKSAKSLRYSPPVPLALRTTKKENVRRAPKLKTSARSPPWSATKSAASCARSQPKTKSSTAGTLAAAAARQAPPRAQLHPKTSGRRLARLAIDASATTPARRTRRLTEVSATTQTDRQTTSAAATPRAPGRTSMTASDTTWRETGTTSLSHTTHTASTAEIESLGTCVTAGRATTTIHSRINDVHLESAITSALASSAG